MRGINEIILYEKKIKERGRINLRGVCSISNVFFSLFDEYRFWSALSLENRMMNDVGKFYELSYTQHTNVCVYVYMCLSLQSTDQLSTSASHVCACFSFSFSLSSSFFFSFLLIQIQCTTTTHPERITSPHQITSHYCIIIIFFFFLFLLFLQSMNHSLLK